MVDSVQRTSTRCTSSTNALAQRRPLLRPAIQGPDRRGPHLQEALPAATVQSDMNTAVGVDPQPRRTFGDGVRTTPVHLTPALRPTARASPGIASSAVRAPAARRSWRSRVRDRPRNLDTGLPADQMDTPTGSRAIDTAGVLGPYSAAATVSTGLQTPPRRVAMTPGQTQQFAAATPGAGSAQETWGGRRGRSAVRPRRG